jgi:hypothetical protein
MCSLMDEWLKKMQYINALEYYSAIIKEGNLLLATT